MSSQGCLSKSVKPPSTSTQFLCLVGPTSVRVEVFRPQGFFGVLRVRRRGSEGRRGRGVRPRVQRLSLPGPLEEFSGVYQGRRVKDKWSQTTLVCVGVRFCLCS